MNKSRIYIGIICVAFFVIANVIYETCEDSKTDKSSYLSDLNDYDDDDRYSNDYEDTRKHSTKVYNDYESACEDGDFDAAHKILNKQKQELKNAIKEAQQFYKENELVKKVGEKKRLFKKNKNIYDDSNRDTYEGMIEECLGMAEQYLIGIIYVYDEEIRLVEVNFPEEQKSKKIEILKGQRITELRFFKSLYLKDTWNRNSFEKVIDKANGYLEDYQ